MGPRNRRERKESSLERGKFFNIFRRSKFPRCPLHLGGGAGVSRWERVVCCRPPALG